MSIIGDRIRDLRIERGWTQEELGEKLGKGGSTVRMWELGRSNPDSPTVTELSKLLHVTADYILGNVSDPCFYLDNQRILEEISSYEDGGEPDPDEVIVLRREAKKMDPEQRKRMMNILKASFDDFDWDD